MKTPSQRRTVLALALSVGLSGCMSLNPYKFSERLDTNEVKRKMAPEKVALAGDLHLALDGLMHQRRLLWEGAGDTETMKNMTALTLVGLTSQAIYKGLLDELPKRWLQRSGLAGAALFGGSLWLEPSKRQKVYLAGSTALSCLALTSAPYEMTQIEFEKATKNLALARKHLEEVFSILHTMGATGPRDSHESRVVKGAWSKAVFADKVLSATERALGSIEQAGPHLRDMTALLTEETAKQTLAFSRDLTTLPEVLKSLRPNATLFAGGADIFKLPEPEKDAPGGDASPPPNDDKPKAPSDVTCKPPKATEAAPNAPVVTPALVLAAQNAAAAASASAKAAKADADRADAASKVAVSGEAASAAVAWRAHRMTALQIALSKMSGPLGASVSLVRRLNEARSTQQLPKACTGEDSVRHVRLVPDIDSITLYPGQSFQFVYEGDEGRAQAHFIGTAIPSSQLSVAQLTEMRTTTVRVMAGAKVPDEMQTTLRMSDSRGANTQSVSVKLCKGG